jgi:hypothetical protein
MNPYVLGLFVLLNAASAVSLFLGYRGIKHLKEQAAAANSTPDPKVEQLIQLAQQVISKASLIHECELILGGNQNNLAVRFDTVNADIVTQSNTIRADIAALGKQFADLSFGTRILNARAKREEAVLEVQEAERARIAAHRLAQARTADPVTAETLVARRKASGLIAPHELNLPQDQFQEKR